VLLKMLDFLVKTYIILGVEKLQPFYKRNNRDVLEVTKSGEGIGERMKAKQTLTPNLGKRQRRINWEKYVEGSAIAIHGFYRSLYKELLDFWKCKIRCILRLV
jgi:hypothetical protein